jgi:hypothetical protein
LNAAQYKVSCNNCTKANNSFVGGDKKHCVGEKIQVIYMMKNITENSIFILIGH